MRHMVTELCWKVNQCYLACSTYLLQLQSFFLEPRDFTADRVQLAVIRGVGLASSEAAGVSAFYTWLTNVVGFACSYRRNQRVSSL